MKNITKNIIKIVASVALLTTLVNADSAKGQKVFKKKLKTSCEFTGAKFTSSHTQDEWEKIGIEGLAEEVQKQCPNSKPIKEKLLKDLYDFTIDFASDSGNVPAC